MNAYIIREGDFRMEETPLKRGVKFSGGILRRKSAKVEIEEYVNPCNAPDEGQRYYQKPVTVILQYPECVKTTEFQLDLDFVLLSATTENVRKIELSVDGERQEDWKGVRIDEGSTVRVGVRKRADKDATVYLYGYDPRVAYDMKKDEPEIDADDKQLPEEYIVMV